MKFLNRQYTQPGPGISKDEPEKKGVALFFSLIKQHFTTIVLLNLLIVVTTLLSQVFFALAIFNNQPNIVTAIICLLIALAISLLSGPTITASMYCMSKFIRHDSAFIWAAFRKKWKECFSLTTLFGMIYSIITLSQIVFLLFVSVQTEITSLPFLTIYMIISLVILLLVPYYFLQAAYLDLGIIALLKNSFLLSIKFLGRSFAALLFYLGFILLQWVFFPFSLPIILTIGYSIPLLIQVMWVWKPIDATFGIDKELRSRENKSDIPSIFSDEGLK